MSEKIFVPLSESWGARDEALHRCVVDYEAAYADGIGPTGQLRLNRSEHLFHILPSIENFARLVICDPSSLPEERDLDHGSSINTVNGLAMHRHSIDKYLSLFPSSYQFSERLVLLEDCAKDLGLLASGREKRISDDHFNCLIETLVLRAAGSDFRKRMRARERRSEDMFLKSKNLVDGLLYEHKKIQIVQVNLGYSADVSPTMELAEAKRYFARFLNLLRNKRVLSSNLGYTWTAGYANFRGFYFRLFMFFEADIEFGTAALSHYLLEFWTDIITDGKCSAFPSDDRINPILHAATGGLACDDSVMYRNMIVALRYLAVKEKHLSMKNRESVRVFGYSHR